MTRKQGKINELLYRSFDLDLDETDREELQHALENSEELRQEKLQAEARRELISRSAEGIFFNPFFEEKVMNRIDTYARNESSSDIFFNSLMVVFKRLALAAAVLCIIIISYNLLTDESLKTVDELSVSPQTYEAMLHMPLF